MTESKQPNADELRRMLDEQNARRLEACRIEVMAALERHNVMLLAEPFISPDGRISARFTLRIKE